jgi:hypothetical protein
MTFELTRINWPNTAAILGLAVMPALSLMMTAPATSSAAPEARVIADATNCPLPGGAVIALSSLPGTSLE